MLFINTFAAAWNYDNEEGWGKVSETCMQGKMQSPIDIQSNFSVSQMPALEFSYNTVMVNVMNNGHTLQVNNKSDNYFEVSGETYKLLQFHFHTPSEYAINGEKFPLEMHFVHQDSKGALGVIGVMLKIGETHPEISKILEVAPITKVTETKDDVIDLITLLPQDRSYYRFMGSLTTPPCSEGVNWFMMQSPIEVSREQLAKFQRIMFENARTLQPTNNRLIIRQQ